MTLEYFENGVVRYLDHYDPLPDDERPRRRRPRHHDSLPYEWW